MELKICVVGCGMIGREHIERIQNRIKNATVVAVCDVFEEGAKKGAEIAGPGTKVYTDFNQAINDPDVNAVVVTTPGAFHKDPVIAAIKAGKPVFSEKPLANTAADCKAVVDAEMASGKHLVQVGFMRRYDRGYNQVKELIDSGKFGAPLVVKCTHRADGVAPDYTTAMAVTDTAIHEIDCLPWLVGDEWDEVQCIMPKVSSKAHEGLKDPQVMIMKTKGGVVVVGDKADLLTVRLVRHGQSRLRRHLPYLLLGVRPHRHQCVGKLRLCQTVEGVSLILFRSHRAANGISAV